MQKCVSQLLVLACISSPPPQMTLFAACFIVLFDTSSADTPSHNNTQHNTKPAISIKGVGNC